MRFLITGNLGFVGSETQRYINSIGETSANGQTIIREHQVIGYDIMDGFDIRDAEQFDRVVIETKPDRILHLAAIARFADADKDPKLAFETNVMGTRNVTLVAKKHKIPLVYSSTGSSVMPLDNYEPPFSDEIPPRGNSVYGVSKGVGELYVKDHTPHIILRYMHIVGLDKRYHGLLGGMLDRIKRGLAPRLYGGLQTNSFVLVKDIARANYLALTAPWDSFNQTYNIGSPEELSAEKGAKIICEVFGYKGKIERLKGRTVDPSRFCVNTNKAKQMLGFETKYNFRQAIEDIKKDMNARGEVLI